jgi:hypothetical protein
MYEMLYGSMCKSFNRFLVAKSFLHTSFKGKNEMDVHTISMCIKEKLSIGVASNRTCVQCLMKSIFLKPQKCTTTLWDRKEKNSYIYIFVYIYFCYINILHSTHYLMVDNGQNLQYTAWHCLSHSDDFLPSECRYRHLTVFPSSWN